METTAERDNLRFSLMSSPPAASTGTETPGSPQFEREKVNDFVAAYCRVREFSEKLCKTLQPEDCVVQTMPEVSPTKWHLAHTSWFFETFILQQALSNYAPIHPQYAYLFNSYYNAAGKMHCRPKRGGNLCDRRLGHRLLGSLARRTCKKR